MLQGPLSRQGAAFRRPSASSRVCLEASYGPRLASASSNSRSSVSRSAITPRLSAPPRRSKETGASPTPGALGPLLPSTAREEAFLGGTFPDCSVGPSQTPCRQTADRSQDETPTYRRPWARDGTIKLRIPPSASFRTILDHAILEFFNTISRIPIPALFPKVVACNLPMKGLEPTPARSWRGAILYLAASRER